MLVVIAVAGMAPAPAGAVGEGERQVSLGLGFALAADGGARPGMQAGLEGALGLSDAWAARLGADCSFHPGSASEPRRRFTTATLGATYALDVVRVVPFADVGLTFADLRTSGADSRQRLGPQVGIGAEYLLSRHWSLAALARFEYLGLRLAGASEPRPLRLLAGIRMGRGF
jgi:hypothetical protein